MNSKFQCLFNFYPTNIKYIECMKMWLHWIYFTRQREVVLKSWKLTQALCNIQIPKHGIYAFPRGQMLLVRGFTTVSDPTQNRPINEWGNWNLPLNCMRPYNIRRKIGQRQVVELRLISFIIKPKTARERTLSLFVLSTTQQKQNWIWLINRNTTKSSSNGSDWCESVSWWLHQFHFLEKPKCNGFGTNSRMVWHTKHFN